MSYSISISGHRDFASPEEAKAFEESLVEQVKAFVAELPSVDSASISTTQLGVQSLTETAGAEPEPAAEPAAESPNASPAEGSGSPNPDSPG